MLLKKSSQILSVLVAVIIASFSISSVSAAEPNITTVSSFSDVFTLSDVSVHHYSEGLNSSNFVDYSNNIHLVKSDNSFSFSFPSHTFKTYSYFIVSCTFDVNPVYLPSSFSSGSFNLTLGDISPDVVFKGDFDHHLFKNMTFDSYNDSLISTSQNMHYRKVPFIIPKNDEAASFDSMTVSFAIVTNKTTNPGNQFSFAFSGLNLDFVYPDTNTISNVIQEPGTFFHTAIGFVVDIVRIISSSIPLLVLFIGIPIVAFTFYLLYSFIRQ